MKELGPELSLLAAKGIRPGSCFVIHGKPDRFCRVTKSGRILSVSGERVPLAENDVWEWFERIEKISGKQFLQAGREYREGQWHERGQPGEHELESLAERFYREYEREPEGTAWHWVCRYDEETLLRLSQKAAVQLAGNSMVQARKRARRIYREMVLAKAMEGGRSASSASAPHSRDDKRKEPK